MFLVSLERVGKMWRLRREGKFFRHKRSLDFNLTAYLEYFLYCYKVQIFKFHA